MKICVIGGGAAGMMAALTAAESGHSVLLLERQSRVGRKLLATGNGRCNLTNYNVSPAHYHGGEASQGLHAVGDGDTGMGVAIVNGHDFHRKNPFQAAPRLLFSYHTTTRWQVAIFP